MRSGRAYIASFGTTGVLVAASLLMLLLVGALMAFKGEAGSDDAQDVPSVLVPRIDATSDAVLRSAADAGEARRARPERASRPARGGRDRAARRDAPLASLGPAPIAVGNPDPTGGGPESSPQPDRPEPGAGGEQPPQQPPPNQPDPLLQAGQTLQQTTQALSTLVQGVTGAAPKPEMAATAAEPPPPAQ